MSSVAVNGTDEPIPRTNLNNSDPASYPSTSDLNHAQITALAMELPNVDDGQISLADLLSRVVQAIYAEMTEFAETMPQMSDAARKRTIADFCVRTKKQVAKLYAVMKWSRDAEIVQKCMNITAFLMDQNQQLLDAVAGLKWTKDILAPAQLRNHDLLTSVDVLTTGSYRRLPTTLKRQVTVPSKTDRVEVSALLCDMENVIRYRLRVSEPLPVEMSYYTVNDGRVTFNCSQLFTTVLTLRGAFKNDAWMFLNVEFLFNIGGGVMSLQEFPRRPSGVIKTFIEDEANARLSYYIEDTPDDQIKPKLPVAIIDAPLIRLYNFLQMTSLSYQLEILYYQANRLRALGWGEFLRVEMETDRKSFRTSYWIRRPHNPYPGVTTQVPVPLLGGVLEISLQQLANSRDDKRNVAITAARSYTELDHESKVGSIKNLSDKVERLGIFVTWEPVHGALGVAIDTHANKVELRADPECIDFEAMLFRVIRQHSVAILKIIRDQLLHQVFSRVEDVSLLNPNDEAFLSVHITREEIINIAIDPRTGRFSLQDTGDLSATVRGPRFSAVADRINEYPTLLAEAISRFRYTRILDAAQQKALYLGFRSFRLRNLKQDELMKFGPRARSFLFIQLALFPSHYLVLVIADDGYKFALIAIRQLDEGPNAVSVMDDIGWLDLPRIADDSRESLSFSETLPPSTGVNPPVSNGFDLDSKLLKELYTYCCARVSHLKVEQQLKESGYIYSHVNAARHPLTTSMPERSHNSNVKRAIPALCVKARDILSTAEAADAVHENVRVMPLSWWGSGKTQVLTCVKLKHLQATLGKSAKTYPRIIKSSRTIVYDTHEGIVSVLSPSIHGCVLHFRSEWSKVSKMVVIAREIFQLSLRPTWQGVTLVSFDLQTVEFTYAIGFAMGIACPNEAGSGNAYTLKFFRLSEQSGDEAFRDTDGSIASTLSPSSEQRAPAETNPHAEINSSALQILSIPNVAKGVRDLVGLLRTSLPILLELESQRLRQTNDSSNPHWCPKGIRWWRFIFSDLRHALDFRIRNDSLLEISDGACSHIISTPVHTDATNDQTARGLVCINNLAIICRQISRNSSVPVVNTGVGIMFSSTSPPESIRNLVGLFIESVHNSLELSL